MIKYSAKFKPSNNLKFSLFVVILISASKLDPIILLDLFSSIAMLASCLILNSFSHLLLSSLFSHFFGISTIFLDIDHDGKIWFTDTPNSKIGNFDPKTEKFDYLPEQNIDGPTAFVSIMEGCNKYCSFCVVPHTRGHEISRPIDDILKEIKGLSLQGVKEINLLGQNVNSYRDSKLKTKGLGLTNLIRASAQIEGIQRIQFTTSHPFEFGQDLIDIYLEVPELISYVHLPVQSGSNSILEKMRRRHTRDEYLEIIDKLKTVREGISISSDFIVGFPGETEDDFLDTLDLVDRVGYDESFSFIYSPRPNTTAKDLDDDVPLEEKKNRLSVLQHKLENSALNISRKMVGETRKCLVTGVSKKNPGEFQARTENNKVVIFSCSDLSLIGKIVDIEIVEAKNKSLRGVAA